MSKYVKIATFSFTPPSINSKPKDMSATDFMSEHIFSRIAEVMPDKPDLIVLPEVSDRPNSMTLEEKKAYYRERGNTILHRLSAFAKDNSLFILYNAILENGDGDYNNASVLIDREGKVIYRYNKNFPVIFEMEDYGVKPGVSASVVECELGRVGAVICFDMNFEELRREYARLKPSLILFSSNYHGGLVRNFFAYDTRSYLVASIGTGSPGEIIDPLGNSVSATTSYVKYTVETVNLDYAVCHLDENRAKFKAAKEKYGDKIKIKTPSYLGPALITSECDEFSAMDIVREFGMELIDDYFDRSRKARAEHME